MKQLWLSFSFVFLGVFSLSSIQGAAPSGGRGVLTHVPSRAGGERGIAVRVVPPQKARYPTGAPVVINVAGGVGPGSVRGVPKLTGCGFVELFFAFPGGGAGKEKSGGTYDLRGRRSVRALADVIRFATGRIADVSERRITGLAGGVPVVTTNCGLIGWSHGGNACGVVMALHGDAFPGLAFYISMESPYGEGAVNVELGSFTSGVNPAYDPSTGVLDLACLAFSDALEPAPFRKRPGRSMSSAPLQGALYFDLDGDGSYRSSTDFPAYVLTGDAGKGRTAYYSPRLAAEAERRSLFGSRRPQHIPSPAGARRFWRFRDAADSIPDAVKHCPKAAVIVYAGIRDHVQAAPDHPHILAQVEGFRSAGARFVRLNPDRSYVEHLLKAGGPHNRGRSQSFADNNAGTEFNRRTIRSALEPAGVPPAIFVAASACEAADRTNAGNWSKNLEAVLYPQAPARLRPPKKSGKRPGLRRPRLKDPRSRRSTGKPYGSGIKELAVDGNKVTGAIRSLLGTNRGPLSFPRRNSETTVSHVESYRTLGIDFIRTHDFYGPTDWYVIFPDWSRDPDDPDAYDFASSDRRIEAICGNGFRCLYRLGTSWKGRMQRPINDPPGTVRDKAGRVIHHADRSDFKKWAKICVQTMRHYTQGWKNGYRYPIVYWEIWNEPDLAAQFWTGTPQQYYMMYEEAAKALKKADPRLKVGGPAATGRLGRAYVEEFVAYCREHAAPLDFFSWHSYGGRGDFNPYSYYENARRIRRVLNRHGFTKTENINDEWNAGIRRRLFSDTPAGAAYYASTLTYFLDAGLSYAFQYCGDRHPGLGLHNRRTGGAKICACTFSAWKRLLETPHRIEAAGTDKRGYTIVAGKDSREQQVQILVSDFQSASTGFRLQVDKLPWSEETPFRITEFLIDAGHRLEKTGTSGTKGCKLVVKKHLRAPFVYLISIEREE